jgi:hypothetical protein
MPNGTFGVHPFRDPLYRLCTVASRPPSLLNFPLWAVAERDTFQLSAKKPEKVEKN